MNCIAAASGAFNAFGSISWMLTVKRIWTCHMEFALYKFIIIIIIIEMGAGENYCSQSNNIKTARSSLCSYAIICGAVNPNDMIAFFKFISRIQIPPQIHHIFFSQVLFQKCLPPVKKERRTKMTAPIPLWGVHVISLDCICGNEELVELRALVHSLAVYLPRCSTYSCHI